MLSFIWSTALLAFNIFTAGPRVIDEDRDIIYQGTSDNGVDQFQGIPFAEDTSSQNRFSSPKPYILPPGSIIDATGPGLACPQPVEAIVPFMSNVTSQGEDCLNLRIARPADAGFRRQALPVMVYIYGGGSFVGQAYDKTFNPVGLIQQSIRNDQPVIWVAMNYRVGIFGFAAAQALDDQKTSNVGLRDQRLALRWIKENISLFGGDPDNVLLYGQSFGAIAAGLQLIAWGGEQERLFHKAILCSGGISGERDHTLTRKYTSMVAEELHCPLENGAVGEKGLECLREAPLSDLLRVNIDVATNVHPPFGFAAFTPVVDNDMIPAAPKKLLEEGRFLKDTPIIATWTHDDGSVFLDPTLTDEEEYITRLSHRIANFHPQIGADILSLYPLSDFTAQAEIYPSTPPEYFRNSRIGRDLYFTCPLLSIAQQSSLHSSNSSNHNQGTPDIYLAELNASRLLPFWDAMHLPWGISHLSDIPYFFNEPLPPPGDNTPAALALAANYSGSFISFAHTGDPVTLGKETFQNWPRAEMKNNDDPPSSSSSSSSSPSLSELTALIIGGPYGTTSARITTPASARHRHPQLDIYPDNDAKPSLHSDLKKRILSSLFSLFNPPSKNHIPAPATNPHIDPAPTPNPDPDPAVSALQDEKLLLRCGYLNSLRLK